MRQSDRLAVNLGNQAVEIAPVVAELSGKGRRIDRLGHRRLVELQVASPQTPPVGLVSRAQGTDGARHVRFFPERSRAKIH